MPTDGAVQGGEVLIHMANVCLKIAEGSGATSAELLRGLSIGPGDLRRQWARFPWDEFATLLDRVHEAVGGAEPFEEAVANTLTSFGPFQLVAQLVVSPLRLTELLVSRVPRRCYANVGSRVDVLSDGRLRAEFAIPAGYRGSLSFGRSGAAAVRAYPRLLGLPDSVVDARLDAHRGTYLITPPSSRTAAARVRQALAREPPGPASCSAFDLDTLANLVFRDGELSRRAQRIGERLLGAPPGGLWQELRPVLEREFCCRGAVLFERAGPGRLRKVGAFGRATVRSLRSRALTVDGQEVGRLELDLDERDPDTADDFLDHLLPWIAAALNAAERSSHPRTAEPSDADPQSGLSIKGPERWASRWQLTPRQTQITALLARGCSNKEIAGALGCSPRTVDVMVSHILQKTGCSSRGVLTARCWTETG